MDGNTIILGNIGVTTVQPISNVTNNTCLRPTWEATPTITQTIIFFCLAFLTIAGNGILIIAVACTRALRTKANILIVSLAVSDLLQGLVSDVIFGIVLWVKVKNYIECCKFFMIMSTNASAWHIFAVTVERFIAVWKPLQHRHLVTWQRLGYAIATIWIYSIAIATIQLLKWKDYSFWLFMAWTALTLLVVITVLHTVVYLLLRKSVKEHCKHVSSRCDNRMVGQDDAVRRARSREQKVSKLIGIITIVFAVCSIPSFIAENIVYFAPCVITQDVKNLINSVFLINSFVNPIIYAFRVPRFRRAVRNLCCCGRTTEDMSERSFGSASQRSTSTAGVSGKPVNGHVVLGKKDSRSSSIPQSTTEISDISEHLQNSPPDNAVVSNSDIM